MSTRRSTRGRMGRTSSVSKRKSSKAHSSSSSSGFHGDGSIVGLIEEHNYEIDSSNGDGNCLFRSLSTGLTGQESYHLLFRQVIAAELSRAVPKAAQVEQERLEEENKLKKKKSTTRKGDDNNSNDSPEGVDEPEIIGSRGRKGLSAVAQRRAKKVCAVGAELIAADIAIPDYHYFVLGDFADYCQKMSTQSVWGGHLEIQAAANITGCKIVVLQDRYPPILVNPDRSLWPTDPTISLYLIYRGACHYDAVLPNDERKENYGPISAAVNEQEEVVQGRHGKVLKGIPLDFGLIEPIEKSWWLSSQGAQQSRDIAEKHNSNSNSTKASSQWDSQDELDEAGGDEDDEDTNPDKTSRRVARPDNHDCDSASCAPKCGVSSPGADDKHEAGGLDQMNEKKLKKEKKEGKADSKKVISSKSAVVVSAVPKVVLRFQNSFPPALLDPASCFDSFLTDEKADSSTTQPLPSTTDLTLTTLTQDFENLNLDLSTSGSTAAHNPDLFGDHNNKDDSNHPVSPTMVFVWEEKQKATKRSTIKKKSAKKGI